MRIKLTKGLDLPLDHAPQGVLREGPRSPHLSLNLRPFTDIRAKLLVQPGDLVKIGQPLLQNKAAPEMFFVSPAGGKVLEVRRGLKRRIVDIVIEVAEKEEKIIHPPLRSYSKEEVIKRWLEGGGFPHIRMRPFALLADPKLLPRKIFVKAVESAPFVPSAEMQLEGREEAFSSGLKALLAIAPVHLVYREGSTSPSFTEAKGVEKHTISGPHPVGNVSCHIHHISPLLQVKDVVWTLTTQDVITLGMLLSEGVYCTEKIIGIGGGALEKEALGYFRVRVGCALSPFVEKNSLPKPYSLISGDPLTGELVTAADFLGFSHFALSFLPLPQKREPLHFLRLGRKKFTATRTYFSGFTRKKSYSFTTNQHGEERAFIDGAIYEKVMPMRLPTMQLVKAILCEDFELAVDLGLLEVAPEDFALPAFICPSKIDMMEIVRKGLHQYSKELGF